MVQTIETLTSFKCRRSGLDGGINFLGISTYSKLYFTITSSMRQFSIKDG